MKPEKRSASRRRVRVPLSCWKLGDGKPTGPGERFVSFDLSATGVSFDAETFYPMNEVLLAELHLPGEAGPLEMRLRISRVESVLERGKYRIGAEFVEPGVEDRERIVSCLKKANIYSILQVARSVGASDVPPWSPPFSVNT